MLEIPNRSVCLAGRRALDSVGQKIIQHGSPVWARYGPPAEFGSLISVRVLEAASTENHSTCAAPPRSYQTMRKGYNPACAATKSNVSSAGPPLWKASGVVFMSFNAVPETIL